jgi:hypothetical protein
MKHQLLYMTEPEIEKFMSTCCLAITKIADRMNIEKPLFGLLVFNDPKVAQYASNCSRETLIKALREVADRLEKREDLPR